jgi:hypothetical protein
MASPSPEVKAAFLWPLWEWPYSMERAISPLLSLSLNAAVTTGAHAVGTYAVNPDCTGSATDMTNDLHYTFVALRHGTEIFLINTDPGNTFIRDFKKQ